MNVATVSMDTRIARIHYLDYRKKVREGQMAMKAELDARGSELGRELGKVRIQKTRLQKMDEELTKVYLALSKGKRILNLQQVFRDVPWDEKWQPKLAIAPATWIHVHCFVFGDSFRFQKESWNHLKHERMFVRGIKIPNEAWNDSWRRVNELPTYPLKALVPTIPPHLRPSNLTGYYLLWEPVWTAAAPADPILLKKISDYNYVVVAQWDLSSVEQMVLAGTPS